ncbi:MAG TPA: SNF2 family helicase [Prolixibacteraceae bacterium]|nr:SNF2 family helicase [Bacteroidales bacterium]HCB61941.1 SNF2 family helicase [Bacteroidales bacterium]HCY42280.1 SNF2 family helicase [Prolixibacteraceae bacterium]
MVSNSENSNPAWLRARISAIQKLLDELPADNIDRSLVRNGVIPLKLESRFKALHDYEYKLTFALNEPLSFKEITSFNTWFALHPEKICGKEIISTSRDFPVTVKGNKEEIISTIRGNGASNLELEALALETEMQLLNDQNSTDMGYLSGITTANSLGYISPAMLSIILANSDKILKIIGEAKGLHGLGETSKTMSFDEVISKYNKGLTFEEIKAWVWYKRSLGIAMKGWERYYIKGGNVVENVVATENTTIKDNHFRDIRNANKGAVLGKYIKTHQYAEGENYFIFRSDDGLYYVSARTCKLEKTSIAANENELSALVKKGALYYMGGEVVPFPIYSFGNMYDRELQLEADKEFIQSEWGEAVYLKHKEAIDKSKPGLLSVTNPDEKERPIITAISDFAADTNLFSVSEVREEFMDVENAEELKKVNGKVERKKDKEKINLKFDSETRYSLQDVFVKWLFTLNADADFEKSSAIDIADYYIANRPLRDDKMSKEEKSELKANARIEGEKLFSRFLHEVLTAKDQEKLDYSWNRLYNGQSDISYHKVPIGFECSATFKSGILQLTDIQREGIAFMEVMGSGINSFDVGVGKTACAIATLANFIYSGKCKRPLIVVPKPTYKKWINEIFGFEDKKSGKFISGILSHTGIQLNDWYNLGTDVVKRINLNKPVPEKSITVVTYEGFRRLGFGDSVSDELFVELVNILGQSREKTARDKEIEYQKFREMIGVGLKDTVADVDVVGFDYIVIDEAHRCKNVFSSVKADEDGNKRYNIQSATSETGQKAFLILNYIQRKFGRNTMLLTATPFTNSPLEIYSMLSLVAYESLTKSGIYNIDTFFDLFVLPTVEWTANYKEEIVEKEVIKSFTNRRILQKLIYNHILYKTGEEAGVKRPKKINLPMLYDAVSGNRERLVQEKQILTYINMTPKQRENQNKIVAMAKSSTQGKLDMGNLFRALAFSLDNALSPFILNGSPEDYKEFIDESPKIKYVMECIRSVKKWHEGKGEQASGQVIYMNRGKQFFPMIKQYLENEVGFERGLMFDKTKVDEVEIISSEINDARKETVKEAFLEGVVKVIIGTATIREGIDLQKRGTVIYDCYPEWNPTDIRQLEGRIWRQGNKFAYVRIVMPLVQDSMDVFVFQKLEEKTSRINDIWFKGDRGNVLDLESLDPEEIKLALITDVDRLVRMFFDQEKEQLNREYSKANRALQMIEEIKSDIEDYNNYRKETLEAIRKFYDNLINSDHFDNAAAAEPDFEQSQKAKTFKKAKELKEEIEALLNASTFEDKDVLAVGRKIEYSYSALRIYFDKAWYLRYFKEYVSKVRKTERTILKPKGFSIESDLSKVLETYQLDKQAIVKKAELYKGDQGSERWKSLRSEIEAKKSALQVEGRTAQDRAEEFARLNYLLAYKADDIPAEEPQMMPSTPALAPSMSELELEAMALEVELDLLSI